MCILAYDTLVSVSDEDAPAAVQRGADHDPLLSGGDVRLVGVL